MVLVTCVAEGLGLMMGCAIPDPVAALAALPMFLIPMMLFAGFFKSLETLPSWFSWLQYVSPFKYGYEYLLVNEFSGLPLGCDAGGPMCPIQSGDDLLAYLDLTYYDLKVAAVALVIITIVVHLIAWAFLQFWSARRPAPRIAGSCADVGLTPRCPLCAPRAPSGANGPQGLPASLYEHSRLSHLAPHASMVYQRARRAPCQPKNLVTPRPRALGRFLVTVPSSCLLHPLLDLAFGIHEHLAVHVP